MMTATMFFGEFCSTSNSGYKDLCKAAKSIVTHYKNAAESKFPSLDNMNTVTKEFSEDMRQICESQVSRTGFGALLASYIIRIPYSGVLKQIVSEEFENKMKQYSYLFSKPKTMKTWDQIFECAQRKPQEKTKCCGCNCRSFRF